MVLAIAIGMLPGWALGADAAPPASRCPGYLAHLQSARTCLARGDRAAAAAELRQAKKALESCLRDEADGDAVADAGSSVRGG